VETRRLGSVSQDTGRPRSDLGRTTPGRTMASRYSAPATCRGLVTPVSQAKGAKPIRKAVSNRCLPPPASVSTCRPSRQHSKGLEPARPNRNTRLGKAHRAQIQPRLKIQKTPCFDLILLTPSTPPGGFRGIAGFHSRARSARPSVPSRNSAKDQLNHTTNQTKRILL
jgi:hypothetical protein